MKIFNLMKEQLQIDFDNIIKTSSFTKRDVKLKQNSLNKFLKTGFPNRRQENWKFSDLNEIIKKNIGDLSFYNIITIYLKLLFHYINNFHIPFFLTLMLILLRQI